MSQPAPLSAAEFADWMRREGESRYHDRHPFHLRMHEGKLSREEKQLLKQLQEASSESPRSKLGVT